jgi:hypothetical protein
MASLDKFGEAKGGPTGKPLLTVRLNRRGSAGFAVAFEGSDTAIQRWYQDQARTPWTHSAHVLRRAIQACLEGLAEAQADFFEVGLAALLPLQRGEIADEECNGDLSLFSRILSGTRLMYRGEKLDTTLLFPTPLELHSGQAVSAIAAKLDLVRLCRNQPSRSDEDLKHDLSLLGLKISRRAVNKYRGILQIPSSRKRSKTSDWFVATCALLAPPTWLRAKLIVWFDSGESAVSAAALRLTRPPAQEAKGGDSLVYGSPEQVTDNILLLLNPQSAKSDDSKSEL